MEMQNNKTPISTIRGYELTARLDTALKQAYHRRSRQLPNNLSDIVETLKGDLLKAFPDCPIETIDDAIIMETLHNPDTTLSPTFFFQAVKKAWFTPKTNLHPYDGPEEDLNYWQQRVKFLERAGMAGSNQHRHACEMVEHYRHGETEHDTISLLDTCANLLADMDERERQGQKVARHGEFKGVRIPLPAFDARREYAYLVMRHQLTDATASHFIEKAVEDVNADRIASNRNRLEKADADAAPEVAAQAMRLAVLDWLRSCTIRKTTPSAILTPLAEELSYLQLRKTR